MNQNSLVNIEPAELLNKKLLNIPFKTCRPTLILQEIKINFLKGDVGEFGGIPPSRGNIILLDSC